jgi:MoxR-like ATPase
MADAPAVLDLLVRLGLAHYSQALEDDAPPLLLLRREGAEAARDAGLAALDWQAQRTALERAWQGTAGPLRRFADRHGLALADLFLAGLAAACEARRAAALGVALLQAPFPGARPGVHLALDLMQELFDAGPGDALALASGKLVGSGLLDLIGEDALPQRTLAIRLPLWRVLAGAPPAWPGARLLPAPAACGVAPAVLDATAAAIASGDCGGVVVRGAPGSGRGAVAAALAARLGRAALEVPAALAREDRGFATACDAALWLPVVRLAPEAGEALTLAGVQPAAALAGTHGAVLGARLIELHVAPPQAGARAGLWRAALGERGDGLPAALLEGAILHPPAIASVARAACRRAAAEDRAVRPADLRAARQALAPDGLGRLAHPVAREVGAEALVAGPALAAELATLLARCRARETVWRGLGPSLAASATPGVRALFAGDSGTGKTLAAAYIATALAAPLYRCDLAAVMNKYIGESEKNLGALLDQAEAADVVLLFDEADALFGRRGEGGETGERYANMLTNYLLTRLEAHGGIVILTANSKARIDPAFWRRLDQVIDFPAPGYAERLALWRSHLGARAPDDAVLERLASYCDLAGGSVRNVVLAAAVMTPADRPIGPDSLTPAMQREYAKLRRAVPAALALALRAAG